MPKAGALRVRFTHCGNPCRQFSGFVRNFEFRSSVLITTGPNMSSREEDLEWLKSTFHPIPKPALPDDCIEYSLYVLDPNLDASNESESKLVLRDVQKYANDLQKQYLKQYLWQRQSFNVDIVRDNGEVCGQVNRASGNI